MRISIEDEQTSVAPERSPESYSEKEKWEYMSKRQRARYLLDYYKLPFFIVFLIIYVICFITYRHVTHKDVVLYVGIVNIAPTESTTARLSDDFLSHMEIDTKKNELKAYAGLYLTADQQSPYYEYNYASQMKILSAIDDEQMDLVLLDRESFDAFSQNGYLYNLDNFLEEPELHLELEPYLISNVEILEDNAKDINFDPTIEYESTAVEYNMGLDVSDCFVFEDAQYSANIYLAIIANTPRKELVTEYLKYLYQLS